MKHSFLFFFLIILSQSFAQTGTLIGTITDKNNKPISETHVISGKATALSNELGKYELELPVGTHKVSYSTVSHHKKEVLVSIFANQNTAQHIVLEEKVEGLGEVTVTDRSENRTTNTTEVKVKDINKISGVNQGVEGMIRSISASTTTNNELSSQYSVRGGNFDENLIYVNGLEIYRPFLVRSGKQEGLSFINSDMVESIRFSAGGFGAEYGDKMASVLDITYRRPEKFGLQGNMSFQGGGITIGSPLKIKENKLTFLGSFRYKNPAFILKSLDTQGDYRPQFFDAQAYVHYDLNAVSSLSFLGNYSRNNYQFIPSTRTTSFGTVQDIKQLRVVFEGQEIDDYESANLALKYQRNIDENTEISAQYSHFRTVEQEFYDIDGYYILGQVDNNPGSENFGNVSNITGVGEYLNHARNRFSAQVNRVSLNFKKENPDEKSQWKAGLSFQNDAINDRLDEWRYIDSLGFSTNGENDALELDRKVFAKNTLNSNRFFGFASYKTQWENAKKEHWTLNAGIRANYWDYNQEFFVSPRLHMSYKPKMKRDMIFKWSLGSYNQSPFYRELRDLKGQLNPDIRSQKSVQSTLANDYELTLFGRPFKMTTELYFKYLWDVIPYQMENLLIKYYAHNNAVGYSTGLEWRLNGEIVKGSESFVSLALMRNMEDVEGDNFGFIPKPTDRALSVSMFYQDHLNKNEDIRFSLAASYATGLPFGPNESERKEQILRIPSYKRVDIGFSYALKKQDEIKTSFLKHFDQVWFTVEVFNLLAINNTQSYLWIKDAKQQEFAVPNYLTGRLLNLKLNFEL